MGTSGLIQAVLSTLFLIALGQGATLRVLDSLPAGKNDFYIGNREPLQPAVFRKLPIGSVQPRGWVRKQLQLEAEGFIGHLAEISPWLDKKDNAWLSPTGAGKNGWEEVPYWLKGFGDLGYVLGDARVIAEAEVWVRGILGSQRADGYFGPESNRLAGRGAPDVWPNMVALNALQSYYEWRADPAVLDFLTRYFKWQLAVPDDKFLISYWEKHRAGDNIASVYWLYNRTGERSLLDLVAKLHRRSADWVGGVPDQHGVNFAQAFREPLQVSVLTKDRKQAQATERDYQRFRAMYGQVPGGMYGADENARPGFDDPRQAAETCAMVEMMLSDEMLLTQTGDRRWAERCEDVTFNSLPASMTPDLKGLRYLTSPNMVLSDAGSKAPGLQNGGPMLLFNPHDHRCCQHNVSHGWPYYAEHLWLASGGNGLAVAMYAPSEVTAQVGVGDTVRIVEETEYPFSDKITFRVKEGGARFPLTLRLPSWCTSPSLAINGRTLPLSRKGAWAVLDRTWVTGETLVLRLPMKLAVQTYAVHGNAVSVNRGPLTYALRIPEKKVVKGGTAKWPAVEYHPAAPWNYAIDPTSVKVGPRKPAGAQPWSLEGTPASLTAKGRRVPEWKLDMYGLVDMLQSSPAFTKEPLETITLVPMGAARLRVSVFPTFATGGGNRWKAPQMPKTSWPASASHVFGGDTVKALSDGLLPKFSNDLHVPRFTWWDHKGTTEWVQYDLPAPIIASTAQVYWFDDRQSNGGCRVPASWRLLYNDGITWREVPGASGYGVARDKFNAVRFEPVKASQWRIEAVLQPGYSSGILEWVLK